MLSMILLVFALVLAAIAGFLDDPNPWRGRLLCFSVACIAGAFLFDKAPLVFK